MALYLKRREITTRLSKLNLIIPREEVNQASNNITSKPLGELVSIWGQVCIPFGNLVDVHCCVNQAMLAVLLLD